MTKLKINPWIGIWSHPKGTIRAIVDLHPNRSMFLLSAMGALQHYFFWIGYYSFANPAVFAVATFIFLLLSPLIGFIYFTIMACILRITGRWVNGAAPISHLRAAFAWSRLPKLIDLAMWFILSAFVTEVQFGIYFQGMSRMFILGITTITSIWSFIVLIQTLSEVQRIRWKSAFINAFLSFLVFYIIVVIVYFIFIFVNK